MPQPPAGWYSDPEQPTQLRWWDGARWTDNMLPSRAATAAAATTATANTKRSGIPVRVKVALIVGVLALGVLLLTKTLGMFMTLAGVLLLIGGIYGAARGTAKLFRIRSRPAAWGALGIAIALIIGGGAAHAALGGGTATPIAESSQAPATADPRAAVTIPTPEPTQESAPKPTPKPSPKRTTSTEVQEAEAIPFARVTVDDPNLDAGKTEISTAGVEGRLVRTYRVTYVDGTEVSRELVSEITESAPIDEVTSNGTRAPASAPVPLAQTPSDCDPNYSGACVPIASDVDCEGGSGNGPAYVRGPVQVIGSDIYDLDRDGDGIACD